MYGVLRPMRSRTDECSDETASSAVKTQRTNSVGEPEDYSTEGEIWQGALPEREMPRSVDSASNYQCCLSYSSAPNSPNATSLATTETPTAATATTPNEAGARALQASKNLGRNPDSHLLEDILSRAGDRDFSVSHPDDRGRRNDDDEEEEEGQEPKSSTSYPATRVPRLDLSWLDGDDHEHAVEMIGPMDRVDPKARIKPRPDAPRKNRLRLYQIDSDPLLGSPNRGVDDDRSHCSSPERLEKQGRGVADDFVSVVRTCKFPKAISPKVALQGGRGAAIKSVLKNMPRDPNRNGSGSQETPDFQIQSCVASVHSNGNQNSKRKKSLNRVLFKPDEVKHKTIREERSETTSHVVGDGGDDDDDERKAARMDVRWNTLDSAARLSQSAASGGSNSTAGLNGEISIATSQVSFNVSRHEGDAPAEGSRRDPNPPKRVPNQYSELGANPTVMDMAEKAMDEMAEMRDRGVRRNKREKEDEEEEEEGEGRRKASMGRCYCFFCGLNCGVWFC